MDLILAIFGALLLLAGLGASPGDGYSWQPVAAVIVGFVFCVAGIYMWWEGR